MLLGRVWWQCQPLHHHPCCCIQPMVGLVCLEGDGVCMFSSSDCNLVSKGWMLKERHQRVPVLCSEGNWKWPSSYSMSLEIRGCWLVFLTSNIFWILDGYFFKNCWNSMLREGNVSGDYCKKDLEIAFVSAQNEQVQNPSALINWTVWSFTWKRRTRNCYFGDCYNMILITTLEN